MFFRFNIIVEKLHFFYYCNIILIHISEYLTVTDGSLFKIMWFKDELYYFLDLSIYIL